MSSNIGPIVISDHASVVLQLADVHPKGSDFAWGFHAYLKKDEPFGVGLLRDWWLEYSSLNEAHRDNPSLFWNTAKVLRGRLMSYAATYMKKPKLAYDKARSQLRDTYTAFKKNVYRSHYGLKHFRFGNKPFRLLANLAKGGRQKTHITAL